MNPPNDAARALTPEVLTRLATAQRIARAGRTQRHGFRVGTDFVMDNGFRRLTIAAPRQPDVEIMLYKGVPGMITAHVPQGIAVQ